MDAAVLEFLADGACGFCRTGRLEFDDFNELGDAAEVVLFVGFAGEVFDRDGDRRVRLLLNRYQSRSKVEIPTCKRGVKRKVYCCARPYLTGWLVMRYASSAARKVGEEGNIPVET